MNENTATTRQIFPQFRLRKRKVNINTVDDIDEFDEELPPRKINNLIHPSTMKENADLTKILKAQRDEYQAKIISLKQQIEAKKKRNEKQKAQFEAQLQKENEKKKKQEFQIQQITNKIPEQQNFDYDKYKIELQEKIDALTKEKESSEKNVEELGKTLMESQQRLKDAREKVKSLPQAANIEALLKIKRQMEKERDSKISYYQEQIKQLNEECKELNEKLDESVKKGEQLQSENDNLSSTYFKLEKTIRATQKKITFLKQQVDENGTMVTPEYVQKKLKEAEDAKIHAIKQKRKELEAKYEKAKKDLEIMQSELDDRNSKVEQLNTKITTLTSEIVSYDEEGKREIKAIKAQHKQNIAKLKEKLNKDFEDRLQQQREIMMNANNIVESQYR